MLTTAIAREIRAVDCARVMAALAFVTLLSGAAVLAQTASSAPNSGQPAAALAQVQALPSAPPTPPPTPRFVVVIDAAHGGDDSGAQLGGSVAEKNITLGLSVRLRSLLTARGFQVVTTREGNTGLQPDARAQIANRAGAGAGAAACLSLHATQAGTGVHIFVSSLAPSVPTRFLAWKTAQSAYVTRSLQLSSVINSAFERGSDAGPIAANLARTSLPGVDSMACPAVALEIAPVRGADGEIETEVTDADYQSRIVDALAASMLEWRTNWEGNPRPSSSQAPVAEPAPRATPKTDVKSVAKPVSGPVQGAGLKPGAGAKPGAAKPVTATPKAAGGAKQP
jgi:N-acetylmuramoyl-L-alanine amidase